MVPETMPVKLSRVDYHAVQADLSETEHNKTNQIKEIYKLKKSQL